MKVDLLMWTLNSSKYLAQVLERTGKVIPDDVVNNRIIVDGKSVDQTVEIAKEHDWTVYSHDPSIPHQANEALKHVESEFFVTLEHDVLLAGDWFKKMSSHMKNSDVAVAQGIRLPTHPVLAKFDWYVYNVQRRKLYDYGISMDNNMYRTNIIRDIGGFPTTCPIAVDRELRDKVEEAGKEWLIDPSVVSLHIKESLWHTIKHDYWLLSNIRRPDQLLALDRLRAVGAVPMQALRMFYTMRDPRMIPYLTIHRLVRIAAMLKRSHEIKKLRKEVK